MFTVTEVSTPHPSKRALSNCWLGGFFCPSFHPLTPLYLPHWPLHYKYFISLGSLLLRHQAFSSHLAFCTATSRAVSGERYLPEKLSSGSPRLSNSPKEALLLHVDEVSSSKQNQQQHQQQNQQQHQHQQQKPLLKLSPPVYTPEDLNKDNSQEQQEAEVMKSLLQKHQRAQASKPYTPPLENGRALQVLMKTCMAQGMAAREWNEKKIKKIVKLHRLIVNKSSFECFKPSLYLYNAPPRLKGAHINVVLAAGPLGDKILLVCGVTTIPNYLIQPWFPILVIVVYLILFL